LGFSAYLLILSVCYDCSSGDFKLIIRGNKKHFIAAVTLALCDFIPELHKKQDCFSLHYLC